MNNRKCLQCYELLKGRADQKFCSDQCRSAYNNMQNVESNSVIKTINRILKKNYSILANLNAAGKTTATKSELLKEGYVFGYFTCTRITPNSRINYFCYNQGFREQEPNKLVLLRDDLPDDLVSPR